MAGRQGLEMLRTYIDASNKRYTLLLGAFRGQAKRPEYRFAGGRGSFAGPYFGIDQASDKLSLDQFRNALMELHINMPLAESEAIFAVMADAYGLVGIVDLMREMKAEPCAASGRLYRASKGVGQHYPESAETPATAYVVPTRRSGYSSGGWRAPPPPPKPHRAAPSAPEKENYRVAPTRSGPFVGGANVLSSQIRMGIDEPEQPPAWRKPPPPPAAVMHPRRTPSGYANSSAVHSADPDAPADEDRWQRESIAARRAPPALPAHRGKVRPSESGFTHESSIFRGTPPPAAPPPRRRAPVAYAVGPKTPWVSGYNRSERPNIAKEAWADMLPSEAPPEAPPAECVIRPTPHSGYTSEQPDAHRERNQPSGQCAFCRLYE